MLPSAALSALPCSAVGSTTGGTPFHWNSRPIETKPIAAVSGSITATASSRYEKRRYAGWARSAKCRPRQPWVQAASIITNCAAAPCQSHRPQTTRT